MLNSLPVRLLRAPHRLAAGLALGLGAGLLPAADDPTGVWTGQVSAPDGRKAAIALEFGRDAGGKTTLALAMPEMHLYGVAVGSFLEVKDGLYALPPLHATWRVSADTILGTFAIPNLPMKLTRGGAMPAKPAAPRFPAPPPILWTYSLGALTWAAPVVDRGVVYVGARDGSFHAVRAADGAQVWKWNGGERIDGRAVLTADAVYFVDGKCRLVCLDRAFGLPRWRFSLHDEKLAGGPVPENPTFNRRTATPLVRDGVVFCGSSDGGLYALDAASGSQLWRHDARAPVFSGIAEDQGSLLFGTMDGSVVRLDPTARKELLRAKTGRGVVTTPVPAGGRLVVGSRDYLLYGLDPADGSVAWTHSYWFSWVESTPVVRDGTGYVGASDYRRVTAFDPATGKARWATDVRGMCWGSPVVTTDTVVIGTAAQNLPGTFIEHAGGIMALDRATGAVRWQLPAAPPPENAFGGYAGTLAHDGERLFAAGFDGNLIALPLK